MANFIVSAQSEEYCGKAYGVMFDHGKAIVSDALIDKDLGRTAEEIVQSMHRDFGYQVEALEGNEKSLVAAMIKTKTKKKPAEKGEGKYMVEDGAV